MTHSTHLPTPTPEQIRALLDAAGMTPYEAAKTLPLGVTARALQMAATGETTMRGTLWLMLRVCLVQSERDALPVPKLRKMPDA